MNKLKKILAVGLMSVMVAGCSSLMSLTNQNQVQTIPKPEIQTFETEQGNVCMTEEDASKFFGYVYELEIEIEDAQSPY